MFIENNIDNQKVLKAQLVKYKYKTKKNSVNKNKSFQQFRINSSNDMTREENAGESMKAQKKSTTRHVNKEKMKPPSKIVIRHLPPTMTEEEFLKQIDPLPPHDFYYYVAADWSLGFDATCRAYLTVKNYEDVYLFRDQFDGYVFVDAKGAEYPAVVEFAPFQGLVKNKSRRIDNKVNTIEEEAHYQQFLIKLEEEREAASKGGECKLEFNLNMKKEEITSTPLLQYLANKKEKRRQESKKRTEEKKRQREDEREKRRVAVQAKQVQQIVRIISATKTDGQTETTKRESVDQTKESNNNNNNNHNHNHNNNKNVAESGEDKEKINARAKRRSERNQRRHDVYLQRKHDEKSSKDAEAVKVESGNEPKAENSLQKDIVEKDKLSRRNRARRERERQKSRATSSTKGDENRKNSVDERKMSGTLQDMPKIQSKDKSSQEKSNNNNHNKNNENAAKKPQNDEEKQRKLRAAEDRRIRNKDRPSIAIYQPKARLRLSEESDNGGNGVDIETSRERSIEKSKTEEIPLTRKVSRYSERRNERRAAAAKEKEKPNAKADTENNDVSEVKKAEIK